MYRAIEDYVADALADLDTPAHIDLSHEVSFGMVVAGRSLVPMVAIVLRGDQEGLVAHAVEVRPLDAIDPDEIHAVTLNLWLRVESDLLLQSAGFYEAAERILRDAGS